MSSENKHFKKTKKNNNFLPKKKLNIIFFISIFTMKMLVEFLVLNIHLFEIISTLLCPFNVFTACYRVLFDYIHKTFVSIHIEAFYSLFCFNECQCKLIGIFVCYNLCIYCQLSLITVTFVWMHLSLFMRAFYLRAFFVLFFFWLLDR